MRQQPFGSAGITGDRHDATHAEAVMSMMEEATALFFRWRAVLEDIHGHSRISGSMRGVLRDLKHHGPQTVPQMARRRPVSRQHIQAIVNELLREGLVCLSENPRHKRSRVVQLTASGRQELADIEAREFAVMNEIDIPVSVDDLRYSAGKMAELRQMLESDTWRSTVRHVLYSDGKTPANPWIDDMDADQEAPIR